MARKTKAQLAAQAQAAEKQAPWAFPKGAEIEAAREASQQAHAQAFFASRQLKAIESEPKAEESQPQAEEKSEEISDEEFAAQQQKAEQAFDEAIKAAQQAAPSAGSKKIYIPRSSIIRPTKAAHALYEAMHAHAAAQQLPAPSRGECIAKAIERGIASGTAATQYQYWKKAKGI